MIDGLNFANLFRQTPEIVCILVGPEHRLGARPPSRQTELRCRNQKDT